jgi:ERCC4-type nuclease
MLITDTREPTDKIRNILALIDIKVPDVIKFEKIDKGDYIIDNDDRSMLIERKNIADFVNSYDILHDRLDEMRLAEYDYTLLIIEGGYRVIDGKICLWEGDRLKPRMSERAFHNYKLSQQHNGTYYENTNDLKETIRTIIFYHDHLGKLGVSSARKAVTGSQILRAFPGIGKGKLKELQKQYTSPLKALENIPGWIGKRGNEILQSW